MILKTRGLEEEEEERFRRGVMKGDIVELDEEGSQILYISDFVESLPEKMRLFKEIKEGVHWEQGVKRGKGKGWMREPRLTCLYGIMPYEYGGRVMENWNWEKAPVAISRVKEKIERFLNFKFDTLLLNRYRNEKDSVGWHSDNERIFGDFSIIASLTLLEHKGSGGIRSMEFKSKKNERVGWEIGLENGSLLIMAGCIQKYWLHRIPRERKEKGERVNLTFRKTNIEDSVKGESRRQEGGPNLKGC